jgi:hypothetical protein
VPPPLLLVPVPVPLTDVDTTTAARRVIIIDKGEINLDPDTYLADRLYQAFLMFNYKIVLCECFDEDHTLDHSLLHMIHGWCAAMKVMFIRHNDFLNKQVQASPSEVVQATKLWLVNFVETNAVARQILSGQVQPPSAYSAAAPGTSPRLVSPRNGKHRYPATKPKQPATGNKRKATTATAAGSKKANKPAAVSVKQAKGTRPRKTSKKLGQQEATAAAAPASMILDDALPKIDCVDGSPLLFEGYEDQAFSSDQSSSLLASPTAVAELSLEPLDKDALHEMDFSDEAEYIDFLLSSSSEAADFGNDGPDDDSNGTTVAVFAEFHDDKYYEELEFDALVEFPNQPQFVTTEDVAAFMDNAAMPLLEMTSEDSADSADDEFLNNIESY